MAHESAPLVPTGRQFAAAVEPDLLKANRLKAGGLKPGMWGLKTATILRRPISSGKLVRIAHRAFAVAVEGRLGGKTHCPLHRHPGVRPIRKP